MLAVTAMVTHIDSFQGVSPTFAKPEKYSSNHSMKMIKRLNGVNIFGHSRGAKKASGIFKEDFFCAKAHDNKNSELFEQDSITYSNKSKIISSASNNAILSLRAAGQPASKEQAYFLKSLSVYLPIFLLVMWEIGALLTDKLPFAITTMLFSVPFWGSIAPFASIVMKLSPMPTILNVAKNKSVGGLPLLPYTAMANLTLVLGTYGTAHYPFFSLR